MQIWLYLWTSRFTNLLFSNSDQYLLSRIMSKRDMDILARDMANASKWFWYPTCWCSNAIDASIFGLALASRPTKQTKMRHQAELPGCLLAIDVFLYKNHHGPLMIRHVLASGIFKAKLTMQKFQGKTAKRRLGSYFLDFLPGKERQSLIFLGSKWIYGCFQK